MPAGAADGQCYLRFRTTVKDPAGRETARRVRPGRCGVRTVRTVRTADAGSPGGSVSGGVGQMCGVGVVA
jgi:hypothetical protein